MCIIFATSFFVFAEEAGATNTNGLTAEVYNVLGQNGAPYIPQGASPVLTTNVPNIDFQWGSGSVLGGPSEDVIVRFTGSILSNTTQNISFLATADDGTRLYIDEVLVADDWRDKGGGGTVTDPISFTAGVPKTIKLMYYENGGGANVFLHWDQSGSMDIIPASAFTSQAAPVVKTIGPPRNLTISSGETSTVLTWEAPNTGNTQPERYAISFNCTGCNGWGIATGNVGGPNSLNTTITIDHSLLNGLMPAGTVWSFHIRSDNDTFALYSANSNVVTGSTYVAPAPEPSPTPTPSPSETITVATPTPETITVTTPTPETTTVTTPTVPTGPVTVAPTGPTEAEIAAQVAAQAAAQQAEAARIQAETAALIAQQAAAAQAEANRIAAEEAARETARIQAEAEAKAEADRIEAEIEAARIQAEIEAQEEADRIAAEVKAAEEKAEADRIAEEERLKAEEEARIAEEEKAKAEEEARIAEEERLKAEAEAKAKAEEDARLEAERIAAEQEAKEKAEEDRVAEEKRLKAEADAKAKEEADRIAAEKANNETTKEEVKEAVAAVITGNTITQAQAAEVVNTLMADGNVSKAEVANLVEVLTADGGKLNESEKSLVADALVASADGEALSSEQIKDSGIEYKDLPAETPVDVRTDEQGNAVVITAEVAAQVELLQDPGALLAEAFSDPGAALAALGSIGADMSTEEREEATDMVVATVVAAGAAINAAAVAAAGGSTGGSTGGGSSGGSSGSPASRGGRRW